MLMFVLGMSLGACIGVIVMGICMLSGDSTPSSASWSGPAGFVPAKSLACHHGSSAQSSRT